MLVSSKEAVVEAIPIIQCYLPHLTIGALDGSVESASEVGGVLSSD